DALRQRSARLALPPRLARLRRSQVPARHRGDARLPPSRDDRPGRGLLLGDRRRLRGPRGEVLRVEPRGARAGARCRRRRVRGALLGRGPWPELRGREHPLRRGRARPRAHRAHPANALRGARAACSPGARRQGPRRLERARGLADEMLRLFWDERLEGFYDTGADHERLIVRPRNLFDNAVPCGSSVAIETLLRLAILTGERRYEGAALEALRPMADLMARHASGFGRFLCALDFHLGPVVEIALVAPPGGNGLAPLVAEVFGRYLPNRVVAGLVAGDPKGAEGIPLLQNREAVGGKATAYVCRNYACELPVTDRESLARQLDAV